MEHNTQRGRPTIKVVAIHRQTGDKIEFKSITEASQALNLSAGNISRVCRGVRKYAGDFVFYYI